MDEFTPEKIKQYRERTERTHNTLITVIENKCQFWMSIPAQPEKDFDLLVGTTCRTLTKALDEIERLKNSNQK